MYDFCLSYWLSNITIGLFSVCLEKGDLRVKTEALKKVIQQILNGEKMPSLLMVIIKFLMPLDDHTIKKLLLIFWEIVPKTGQDSKLLQEMILVCDAYRKVKRFNWRSLLSLEFLQSMKLIIILLLTKFLTK